MKLYYLLDVRGNDWVEIQHGLVDGPSKMGATPSVNLLALACLSTRQKFPCQHVYSQELGVPNS